jgi:hypothetical protein
MQILLLQQRSCRRHPQESRRQDYITTAEFANDGSDNHTSVAKSTLNPDEPQTRRLVGRTNMSGQGSAKSHHRTCGKTQGWSLCRFVLAAGLLGVVLMVNSLPAHGASGKVLTDADAHFSLVVPETAYALKPEHLDSAVLSTAQLRLGRKALDKYDKVFVLPSDQAKRIDKSSLVVLGIQVHRHLQLRFNFYEDYLTTDEFFNESTIREFAQTVSTQLVEQGASDAVVENLMFDKIQSAFSFTCRYTFPGEDEIIQYSRVFLGGMDLVYLDMLVSPKGGQAFYKNQFQDITDSLVFDPGFQARQPMVEAFIGRIASYELFGTRVSGLAKKAFHICLIIALMNIAIDRSIVWFKRSNRHFACLIDHKNFIRIATVPVGIVAYLLII